MSFLLKRPKKKKKENIEHMSPECKKYEEKREVKIGITGPIIFLVVIISFFIMYVYFPSPRLNWLFENWRGWLVLTISFLLSLLCRGIGSSYESEIECKK